MCFPNLDDSIVLNKTPVFLFTLYRTLMSNNIFRQAFILTLTPNYEFIYIHLLTTNVDGLMERLTDCH